MPVVGMVVIPSLTLALVTHLPVITHPRGAAVITNGTRASNVVSLATALELRGLAAPKMLARSTASNILLVAAKSEPFAAALGAAKGLLKVRARSGIFDFAVVNVGIGADLDDLDGRNEQALESGKCQTKLQIPHGEMILSVRIWSTVKTKQKGKGEFLERLGDIKDPFKCRNRKAGMSFIYPGLPSSTQKT